MGRLHEEAGVVARALFTRRMAPALAAMLLVIVLAGVGVVLGYPDWITPLISIAIGLTGGGRVRGARRVRGGLRRLGRLPRLGDRSRRLRQRRHRQPPPRPLLRARPADRLLRLWIARRLPDRPPGWAAEAP